MHASLLVLRVGPALALMAACADAAEPTIEEACNRFADASARCPVTISDVRIPADVWRATVKDECLRKAALPHTHYTSQAIIAGAEQKASHACGDTAATLPAIAGDLADGERCRENEQCRSTHCASLGNACGTCTSPIEDGDACTDTDICARGLRCIFGICHPNSNVGGECDSELDCMSGLLCKEDQCAPQAECASASDCLSTFDCVLGGCAKRLGEGAHCGDANLPKCAGALQCVGGTCRAPEYHAPHALGESCADGNGCSTGWCSEAQICVAPSAEGGPCDQLNSGSCGVDMVCRNGACVKVDYSQCE